MRFTTLTFLFLLSTLFPTRAQCFFSDDYSNPSRWTLLNTGIAVQNGRVEFSNTSGSTTPASERGVYRPLPTPLPDAGGWRLDVDLDYATAAAGGSCLMPVGVAAGGQHPLVTFNSVTGLYEPTRQDGVCLQTDGPLGQQSPLPLYLRVSDDGAWQRSDSLTLRENAITYLRLERLNATQLRLSAFTDAARTQHQAGSPLCMTIPASITDLSTLWHGNLPWGEVSRNDDARVDNLCLSTIPLSNPDMIVFASIPLCFATPVTPVGLSVLPDFTNVTWTLAGSSWTATGSPVQFTPPAPGTYTFTAIGHQTDFCGAPDTATMTVTINPAPLATLAYDSTTYCPSGQTMPPTVSPPGGTFRGTAGLAIDSVSGIIDLAASVWGSHTVRYEVTGLCPLQATAAFTIASGQPPTIAYRTGVICQSVAAVAPTLSVRGGTFSGSPGLALNPQNGVIRPVASTAGVHTVTYTTPGPCALTATCSVTINAEATPTLTYDGSSNWLCSASLLATPTVTPTGAGGTFSGTAGLVIEPATGVIDLMASTSGQHVVTYATPSPCSRMVRATVWVLPTMTASIAYPAPSFCQVGFSPPPDGYGEFGGDSGLVVDSFSGVIDLEASTVGTHTVTCFVPGMAIGDSPIIPITCGATATTTVTITPRLPATLTYANAAYCQTGYTDAPAGRPVSGTYTGSQGLAIDRATGIVNLAASAVGTHTVTYTSTDSCTAPAAAAITVEPLAAAALTYPEGSDDNVILCQGAAPTTPTFGPGGGTFAGTPGLTLDPVTGVIDAAQSTVGEYHVTYTPTGDCARPATVRVSVGGIARVELPNVITPNNDGLNDAFAANLTAATAGYGYRMRIFNRWGTEVWDNSESERSWTADNVAPGLYHYYVKFSDCAGEHSHGAGWK